MKRIVFFQLTICLIVSSGLMFYHPAQAFDRGAENGVPSRSSLEELQQKKFLLLSSATHEKMLIDKNLKMADIRVPFLPNQGQVDQRVSYYARTFGGTMFITRDGELVYSLPLSDRDLSNSSQQAGARHKQMVFVEKLGNGMLSPVTPVQQATTRVSIFHGDDPQKWQQDLPGYPEISLGRVYPGIEVRLAAHGNSVEKLFYVGAGADPQDINIEVSATARLRLTEEGGLDVSTEAGNVQFSRPVAWQDIEGTRKSVEVAYAVNSINAAAYGFELGSYDPSYPLVIDPLLQSTYLGGSSNDQAADIAIGPNGSVYVVGQTYSNDFPHCTNGPCAPTGDDTFSGSSEAFVVRVSADLGTLIQTTFLGGSGDDSAEALVIDGSGNVYVTGDTDSIDFPGKTGGADTSVSGRDGFVAKLTPNLRTLTQSTYVGGSGSENPRAIVISNSNEIVIAGTTTSSDLPACASTTASCVPYAGVDTVSAGPAEGFLARFHLDLKSMWATTYLGGSNREDIYGLAVAATGNNLYVCGTTTSSNFPFISGAVDITMQDHEAFVTRINDSLISTTAIQSTYFGGSGYDECYAITMSNYGGVLITGETDSTDLPHCVGICGYQADTEIDVAGDAYVAHLSADLQQVASSTYLGGTGFEMGTDIVVAPEPGNAYGSIIYVTGETYAKDFQKTHDGADPSFVGGSEGFVVLLDSVLSKIKQATFLGGNNIDFPAALAVSNSGDIYVTGYTRSSDFPRREGGFDMTLNGTTDAFVARFSNLKGNGAYYPIPLKNGKAVILHID